MFLNNVVCVLAVENSLRVLSDGAGGAEAGDSAATSRPLTGGLLPLHYRRVHCAPLLLHSTAPRFLTTTYHHQLNLTSCMQETETITYITDVTVTFTADGSPVYSHNRRKKRRPARNTRNSTSDRKLDAALSSMNIPSQASLESTCAHDACDSNTPQPLSPGS